MAIEKKEVEFAKEIDDVLVLMTELIKVVKTKGEYTELMDELITAINGADQIPAEAENLSVLLGTVGLRVGGIVDAFKAEPAA